MSSAAAAVGRKRPRRRGRFLPYILLSPLVLFIGALALYPTVLTTVQAFFTVNPTDPPTRFSGLANFRALTHNPFVRQSAANTVLYIIVGVGLSTLIGLGIALMLQRRTRWRGLLLAVVVLPWALPAVVESVIWGWIYEPTFGVLNSVLKSLGLIHTYQVWIGIGRVLSIVLIEIVQVWQIAPLAALLILAALQAIPQELYEAARVDGAGRWQMFRRITVPLIRPGLAVAMVETLILSLNVFDQVYVLNGFAPGGASIMMQTYQISFNNLNFGQGYALSLLATIATVVFSLIIIAVVYRRVEF
ncbi:MAG TPA: sugar ABC transporter permease [Thermoleophilia bacterium]|nr:sugar ABC transporter permease [Thermoleophilia bacterium]